LKKVHKSERKLFDKEIVFVVYFRKSEHSNCFN